MAEKQPVSDFFIEQMHIISADSETHKLAVEKISSIIKKLLSKYDGQYNLQDFDFVVCDLKEPNAFYINKSKTDNGKHVLGITKGIISFCNNEDEFAGVIGHELGHFLYKEILKGDKNSVFQERGADLRSLDLMLDAGYNPVAYRNIAERFQSMGPTSELQRILSALDVHGDDYSRVEDIEAYLTYLKKERGEFPRNGSFKYGDWNIFSKSFGSLIKKDAFDSYLLKRIKQKFGGVEKIDYLELCDFLFEEVKSGHVMDSAVRTDDLINILEFGYNNLGENNTKEYKEKVYKKYQELVNFIVNSGLKSGQDMAFLSRLSTNILDRRFKPVGPIVAVYDSVKKIIDSQSKEECEQNINETNELILKIPGYDYISQVFEMPAIMMPEESKALNAKMPGYFYSLANSQRRALHGGIRINIQFPGNAYRYIQRSGIIIAVGEKGVEEYIKKENELIIAARRKKAEENNLLSIKQNEKSLSKFSEKLQYFDDYAKGKMDAKKCRELLGSTEELFDEVFFVLNFSFEEDLKDSVIESIIKTVKADKRLYEFFDFDNAYKEKTGHDEISHIKEVLNSYKVTQKKLNLIFSVIKNIRPIDYNDFFSLYKKYNSYMYIADYDEVAVNKRIDDLKLFILENATIDDLPKFIRVFDFLADMVVIKEHSDKAYDKEFIKKSNNYMDMLFQKLNIQNPVNYDTFAQNIEKVVTAYHHNGFLYEHVPLVDFYIVRALRNNVQFKTVGNFINMLDKYYDNNFYLNEDVVLYLSRNKTILEQADFYKLSDFYIKMENKRLFSERASNQSIYLDLLIEKMMGLSRDKREEEALLLLTGVSEEHIRREKELKFPNQKNKLMEIYTDALLEKLGKDDGSQEYYDKVKEILNLLNGNVIASGKKLVKNLFDRSSNRNLLSQNDKNRLFRMLSDKLVCQERLAVLFNETKVNKISSSDIEEYDVYGRTFEFFLALLTKTPETAKKSIAFLNHRLTEDSKRNFVSFIESTSSLKDVINNEMAEIFYNTFWMESLEVRSVIMNKLLDRIGSSNSKDEDLNFKIEYVCNMHFPKEDKYRKDAELIFKSAIMAFDDYERGLILSAIASSDKNKDEKHKNSSSNVGEGLRMFFENMGPAWVKFGQLMSYVPELPSEIRKELAKLKDNADIPARWDLFEQIKSTLPNEILKNIESVDEILGAGSFWITAKIHYKNEQTGKTEEKVLSLLRPYAAERSIAGFKTIKKAIEDLAKHDKKYLVLSKVAARAEESARHEVDVVYGAQQLEKAKKIYGDLSVTIDGKKYTPKVANWEYYGVGKDKVGYKLMEMAQGKTLNRIDVSTEEKRKMALAYVTIELANLFKGDVWDIDRHMGQQNFELKENGDCYINIYDTGAQMQKAPDKTDLVLLGEVLYGLIRAARIGKPIDKQILDTIEKMDDLESVLKVDTNYVSEVQRGLMALSDIIEYQKEIKDIDGNVIQPSLSLTAEDLSNAVEAVYDNPTTNSVLKMSLAGKVLLNKLRPWRKGWASSLDEGLNKKNKKNPIKIEKENIEYESESKLFDKPEQEINRLEQEKRANEQFGINKKYIKIDNNAVTNSFDKGLARA